jgi:hypothetical protein
MAAAPELNSTEETYLKAMVDHCQADPGKQASMYTVGEAVGLDRDTASRVCQELIAFGLVEIRTLSGGVGLTTAGLEFSDQAGDGSPGHVAGVNPLKKGPILNDDDRQSVTAVLDDLKQGAGQWRLTYDQMAEFVADVKTIETQLLSPKPKTAVVKAVCGSIEALLRKVGDSTATAKVHTLAGD